MTITELLKTPRIFTEAEITALEEHMLLETAKNPLYPAGLDAVMLRLAVGNSHTAARINADEARLYPQRLKDWEANHIQNPAKYPLSFRPVPAKKILVGLGKVEGSPFEWPVWVQSEELVCTPVPLPAVADPSQRPLTVSIGKENPRVPGEYLALPDDNAPDGHAIVMPDGKILVKNIYATPFGSVGVWRLECDASGLRAR